MSFTSVAFLLFLPIIWSAYWLLRSSRRWQNALLVAASYFFYGYWDWRFCGLMLASSLIDFAIGRALHAAESPAVRRAWLWASIGCNLGLLGFFKYFNFFLDGFRQLLELFGMNAHPAALLIILPVGISFYTFQTLSYTIDIYRGRLKARDSLLDYLAFVSFFPQLVAGPIERASRLLPQFETPRSWSTPEFQQGCRRVLWGLFKKIVIADTLAEIVVATYANPAQASGTELAVATVLFSFQIYCDFCAYSDIAIGVAKMFGIQLSRNFAYPYFSQSMWEFWQRWHISLSSWFRDYVYIPLGGNREGHWQQRRNVVATFLLSGLWHGAAWRFLAWGGLHGVASLGLRPREPQRHEFELSRPGGDGLLPSPLALVRMLLTFGCVSLLWVFFRADSLSDSWLIVETMALDAWNPAGLQMLAREYWAGGPIYLAANLVAALVLVEWCRRNVECPLEIGHWPEPLRWSVYTTVFWLVVQFADKTQHSPFVYFQF
ncbi:MAG: MBOAT family protein [Planctomycetales bacterium]|nr:MBOAT family protein [Planctomycetales bacterium]